MTGDCFRGSNQVYNLADDLVDGKPHYVGATTPLHIYYDATDHVWLMDDDLDTHAIHAHMNSADTFPSGRRLWTSWCGPYFGWSELVVELTCSGMCEDTCAGYAHDG